jgi:hypothetical protein
VQRYGFCSRIGRCPESRLRGASQSNIDFSIPKRFLLTESKALRFQDDFFNLLNHANHDGPLNHIAPAISEEL